MLPPPINSILKGLLFLFALPIPFAYQAINSILKGLLWEIIGGFLK